MINQETLIVKDSSKNILFNEINTILKIANPYVYFSSNITTSIVFRWGKFRLNRWGKN
jgi:hypothetical protein